MLENERGQTRGKGGGGGGQNSGMLWVNVIFECPLAWHFTVMDEKLKLNVYIVITLCVTIVIYQQINTFVTQNSINTKG